MVHHQRGVGGRRDAAGREVDDRQPAAVRRLVDEPPRRTVFAGPFVALLVGDPVELADGALDVPLVRDGLVHVARARLALRANHRRALVDAAERLGEVARAADERRGELALVDVVVVVRRGEHLASSIMSTPMDSRICASVWWPMRAFPITGMETASIISVTSRGRPSGRPRPACGCRPGRLQGMTATAPASSAIRACSAVDDVHDDAALLHLREAALDEVGPAPELLEVGLLWHYPLATGFT